MIARGLKVRTTAPGSTSHAIAESVREACAVAGVPLLVSDHRAAYAARHGDAPRTFGAQFYSLVRRGILVAVDGRSSRTRYRHRESVVVDGTAIPTLDTGDDALVVLRALECAVAAAGGPATTAQVATALRATGGLLGSTDINAVRTRLATLARTRRSGVAAWRAPRVIRQTVTTAGGRRLACWSALTTTAGAVPTAPVYSGADAVRALVAHVQGVLARPVFRRELAWWLEAHPDHAVARDVQRLMAARKRSLSEFLAFTERHDRRRIAPAHTLARLGDQFSCWGGMASRYWVGPLYAPTLAADCLEEVACGLRVADERATLERLARRAERLHLPALAELVAVRHTVLAAARDRHVSLSANLRHEAGAALEASYPHCRAWAAAARTEDGRYARVEDLRVRERHMLALATYERPATARASVAVVGEAAVVSLEALERFLVAVEPELGLSRALARRAALHGVRRIPLVPTGGRRFGSHPARADVGFDRVDALLRLYRLVPASRTHALLDSAADLLGPVLRDTHVLGALYASAMHAPALRRAALVALALLGVPPEAVSGARHPQEDLLDARARLLAQTLTDAPIVLGETDPRLAVAVRRLQHGRLLTALG